MALPYQRRIASLNKRISGVKGRIAGIPRPEPRVASQLPWDAQYNSEVAQQNLNFNNAQARLSAQEAGVRQNFGIDDTSNPFSRARLLQQSFDNARRNTWNSAAAAGQGYSGSTSEALSGVQRGFNQDYNALRQDYSQSLADIDSQRTQAEQDRQNAIISAKASQLERSIASPLDPTTAPADQRAPLEQRLARLRQRRQTLKDRRRGL